MPNPTAQHPFSIEDALIHLRARNWSQLRSWWLPYVPRIQPPGSAPGFGVSDLVSVEKVTGALLASRQFFHQAADLEEVRTTIFSEAVFALHKAANVAGAAEVEAVSGFCSWSVSSTYQASYFAARSILSFLGIATLRGTAGGKDVLIDVWSEDERLPQRRRQRGHVEDRWVQLFILGEQVTHRGLWRIFQRVIRTLRVDLWPQTCLSALRHLEEGAFARQRNNLHYDILGWPFEDLHRPACPYPSIFEVPKSCDRLRSQTADFPLSLAFILVELALGLLRSCADQSERIAPEASILEIAIMNGRNPLLSRQLVSTPPPRKSPLSRVEILRLE